MSVHTHGKRRKARRLSHRNAGTLAFAALMLPGALHAQTSADGADATTTLDSVTVTGNWLGTGLQNSVKSFAGARSVVKKEDIQASGAASIADVMRRIPGVQATENSSTAGSAMSLNIGVRGLTGRFSPRSTVLLDGVPLAVAPYGQPQLSFAPVSLNNIESVDVVRGGGAVRYGPQNVGGIVNFKTRAVPGTPGISGDATLRQNDYGEGGHSTQYGVFLGGQLDNGLGLALLYSGLDGSTWRAASDEKVNDLALKFRYALGEGAEVYGKASYYDVNSRTPGGLTVAEYAANPFQNTRPTDYWKGERKGLDLGYVNTLSDTQEFEIRAFYNDSFRQSTLINAERKRLTTQPRNYEVLGLEPRYTQRMAWGATSHDVTVGYRYIRERGDDNAFTTPIGGSAGATTTFDNATDAHAVYVDDRIAFGAWRVTPGVRFEHIRSRRDDPATAEDPFKTSNDKTLPSLNVAYLVNRSLTLFTNYNTSFGPVQNTQLNSQTDANPLKPEVAKTAEIGARWRDGRFGAEVTAFDMRFDNQILQVPGVTPVTFRNVGATKHQGLETAFDYTFERGTLLAGLNLYANYSYTKALQDSGEFAGRDVPFYSRHTDTVGARYQLGAWGFNLSSTHQSSQYSDVENTVAESASANKGRIPGFRVWNAQLSWKLPMAMPVDLLLGVNNLSDKRYYTRNVDNNAGRMVGAPRMVYVQGRVAF